jgi:hypothetical protein
VIFSTVAGAPSAKATEAASRKDFMHLLYQNPGTVNTGGAIYFPSQA